MAGHCSGSDQALGYVPDESMKHDILIMNGIEQLSMVSSFSEHRSVDLFLISRSSLLISEMSCQHSQVSSLLSDFDDLLEWRLKIDNYSYFFSIRKATLRKSGE